MLKFRNRLIAAAGAAALLGGTGAAVVPAIASANTVTTR
jgi:hypothetical protein